MSVGEAKAVLARSGRTFHLASLLLPARMREQAAELYGFCRRMDDVADEGGKPEELRRVIRVLEEEPLSDEAEDLGWPVTLEAHFPGISKVAVTLTRSLAADAGPRRMETKAELLRYAFGVAGTVGLMMCRILGAPPEGAQAASHLGIAMQLTNIARDVREDLGRDRIYVPAAWLAPEAVRSAIEGGDGGPLVDATGRLLALAESFYASADRGMHYLPRRARVSILAAAACYREIGVAVGRDVPASWRRRTVVSRGRKAVLLLRALGRAFGRGSRRAGAAERTTAGAAERTTAAGAPETTAADPAEMTAAGAAETTAAGGYAAQTGIRP